MIDHCFDEIASDAYFRHLVIIPEHYSYEMERMAVDRFGVIGINNVEVVTPHRMAVNLLLKDSASYLNPAGKQMLAYLAVSLCAAEEGVTEEVRRIMNGRAFTSNMVTLISEFKRHMVTPEMLSGCAKAQRKRQISAHLADKLDAAAAVYAKYNELLSEKSYVDMDDDIYRLAAKIEADIPAGKRLYEADMKLLPIRRELDSCTASLRTTDKSEAERIRERIAQLRREADEIRAETVGLSRAAINGSTRVWFMCFDEYLPHHMRLVEAAVKAAGEVTVCLHYVKSSDASGEEEEKLIGADELDALEEKVREIYGRYDVYTEAAPMRGGANVKRDAQIYELMEKSYRKLKALDPEEYPLFTGHSRTARSKDIDFLVRHYGFLDRYRGESKSIRIAECTDPHSEIEFAAETIHTLVRESEARYERSKRKEYAEDMQRAEREVSELIKSTLKAHSIDEERADELRASLAVGRARTPDTGDILRYRDFGMVFGGAIDHAHILDSIFTEHNIRYYADDKLILSEHPIAVQLLSIFDICRTGWSYEAMLRYLNAGFIFKRNKHGIERLDAGEIARVDNYVVRYDIRGRQLWSREWSYSGEIFAMTWEQQEADEREKRERELVNALRKEITEPLLKVIPLSEDEERPASEYVDLLCAFLEDIHIYEGLKEDVRRFEDKGMPQTAQQFGQIWNKLIEVINQIRVTMGDMEISFDTFGEYLRAGLSKCEITTIPSSLDAVYTGTVERSTSKPVKMLFVMGAVSGTYPSSETLDGFFTDIDRSNIRSYGSELDLAPTKTEQRAKQRYKVFKALRTATDSICVTYPLTDNEGGTLRRSSLVQEISDMFGIEAGSAFPADAADEANITSVYAARKGLIINSAAPMSRLDPVWRSVYRCLRDDGSDNGALDQIALAASYYTRPPRLMPETASALYTRNINGESGRVYSATRLDSFAECPMKFFMQYGLRLAEDVQAGVQANEIGTYVHTLVQKVCDGVYKYDDSLSEAENAARSADAWKALDEEDLGGRIDELIEKTSDALPQDIADRSMRGRLMERISNTVRKSAANVLRSLKYGKFVLKASELEIDNARIDDGVYIKGYVDRVDEFVYDDGTSRECMLRIIDYKTGKTAFSESDIKNGRNMQLMVYAIAAAIKLEEEGNYDKFSLSGVYYQYIRDQYEKAGDFEEDKSLAPYYLSGQTYLPDKKKEPERRQALLDAINEEEHYIGLYEFTPGHGGKKSKSETARDALIARVKENISSIDREIMSGTIAPRPYSSGGSDSCSYCRFKDICSYEDSKPKRNKEGE